MFCQFHRASTWNLEMIPLVDIFPQLDPYELLWALLPEVLDSLGPSNESQVEREMFPTVRLNYLGYLIVVDLTQLQCLCCKKIWRLRETHAKRSFLLCGWVLHFTQVEEPSHRLTFLLLLFVAWDIHGLAMSGGWIISWTLSINSLSSSRLLCCVFSKDPSTFIAFALPPCGALASLSVSPVILLCTHYFSRANLFPRMEETAYLEERNFARGSCSGQISRQLLIG